MPGRRHTMLFVVVCVVVGWAMPHAQASSLIWRESGPDSGDELLFYESDGTYQVYNLPPDGSLPTPSLEGDDAGTGWDEVTAVDLDGDGQDEMLFYRQDGTFSFNEVNFDGSIGTTISAGSHYTSGWSAITAVDLDGDGQDEVFFYRDDGIYRFYDVRSNGSLPTPIRAGDDYTTGWDSISAVDLDGDGQDEMFFYREDGLFRYYDIRVDGSIPKPLAADSNYTTGWNSIFAIDLNGDGQDEMFFYREDGLFRYYDIRSDGSLPAPIKSGGDYPTDVDVIVGVEVDWHPRANTLSEPMDPFILVSPFGMRLHPILDVWLLHAGIDLDAEIGDPIYASASGVVLSTRWSATYGNVIDIDHGGELHTRYAHLSSFSVAEGDWVETGQVIGLAGSTGLSTGPHLHFETLEWGEPVDPLIYLPQ